MRKALRSRAYYDWDTHRDTRQRNRDQIAAIPAPEYPATGTARIGKLIAEARRRRDQALLAAHAGGGAGISTVVPLDKVIESPTPAPRPSTAVAPTTDTIW